MDKKQPRIEKKVRQRIRKSYKFCCDHMEWYALDETEELLDLDVMTRSCRLHLPDKTCTRIKFCPWCGSQLPKYLYDEWERILTQEYGIQTPSAHMDDEDFPPEFLTEEWWKKRGL